MTPTTQPQPQDLPLGAVVRWRAQRTEGYGQIAGTDPDGRVRIRTWLPCPTKEQHVQPGNLTVLCTLDAFLAVLP